MIGAVVCFGMALCIIAMVAELVRAPVDNTQTSSMDSQHGWVSGDERREDGLSTDEDGPQTGGARDGF